MYGLLNLRFLLVAAVAAGLAFTHFFAYRGGKNVVRQEWNLARAEADRKAWKLGELRQANVDAAAVAATKRKAGIVADSRGAAAAVDGLRDALATRDLAEESAAAATQRAAAAEQLLLESGSAYQELAAKADGHASDVKMLLEAWPP